jgi:hypothetical protein
MSQQQETAFRHRLELAIFELFAGFVLFAAIVAVFI